MASDQNGVTREKVKLTGSLVRCMPHDHWLTNRVIINDCLCGCVYICIYVDITPLKARDSGISIIYAWHCTGMILVSSCLVHFRPAVAVAKIMWNSEINLSNAISLRINRAKNGFAISRCYR